MKTEHAPAPCAGGCGCVSPEPGQRRKLATVLALALTPLMPAAWAQDGARTGKKPRPGDRLAFALGDRKGQEITPADIKAEEDAILAHPMDPGGQVLESRANLIALTRLPEDVLSAEVKPHAPEGIVAYSAVCTHYGCPVTKADPAQHTLICNCHGSAFDAAKRGVVVNGPAIRRLPMLPLKLDGTALAIGGGFDGPIGPPT